MLKSQPGALLPLVALLVLLPFEPLEPLARVFGFQMSHLEVFALALMTISCAAMLGVSPRRSRPIPLLGYAVVFVLACLVSSLLTETSSALPLKFTLRMAAAAVVFLLTSQALGLGPRFDWLFFGFATAGAVTAAIALLEASGWPPLESWIAPFREHGFEVGGRARVAATFSYPNTAGGFLVLTLPPALFFLVRDDASPFARTLAWSVSLGMLTAVVFTYSRGALVGSLSATLSFWHLVRRKGGVSLAALHGAFAVVAAVLFFLEPSYRWRASSEGDRSWYRARIEPDLRELALRPGELTSTRVQVDNVGKLSWDSTVEKPFYLSYRWFRSDEEGGLEPVPIEGERTALPSRLAPGRSLGLEATVRAPGNPGSYFLIWDMVQEHTTWFSDKVGLGAPVRVSVGRPGAAATLRPKEIRASIAEKAWRPGRRELWRLALEMFASHPVFGVGPDNFRWLYGPAAGRKEWDTRVFSNSLYFELLATVGLSGFCAFGLLLGKSVLGLLSRARAVGDPGAIASAAIAASLLGFLVHGLVDYLLAFTPIYLALFILLGASSASIAAELPR